MRRFQQCILDAPAMTGSTEAVVRSSQRATAAWVSPPYNVDGVKGADGGGGGCIGVGGGRTLGGGGTGGSGGGCNKGGGGKTLGGGVTVGIVPVQSIGPEGESAGMVLLRVQAVCSPSDP